MTIARGLRRLWRNELTTLLTQGGTHEALFDVEINGRLPGAPSSPEEQEYYRRWRLPELGFRNYWYPVILSKDLTERPTKRRLLGEDIVFWRDGGKAYALADRCPHRGASLAAGHVRFPGSGTISCPYHGWTFDGQGALRACIQEGPESRMVGKVRTAAYAVEERLGVVWVWIGDLAPVPIEDDLPVAMQVPGVHNFIHFTPVWRTNWAPLFDNFMDGIHAPYLHRASPQNIGNRLPFRTIGAEPTFDFVDHDGKVLEVSMAPRPGAQNVDQAEFPGLGTFPRQKWWRVKPPRPKPERNFVPGFKARSFLYGLPCYVHTIHENQYFTQFIIPIDRDHLYSMCAMTGHHTPRTKRWWTFYYPIYQITHDTMFVGQDHRVLRETKIGRERLSAWDQDIIRWRQWAVRNARGYTGATTAPAAADAEANGAHPNPASADVEPNGAHPEPSDAPTPALAGRGVDG